MVYAISTQSCCDAALCAHLHSDDFTQLIQYRPAMPSYHSTAFAVPFHSHTTLPL